MNKHYNNRAVSEVIAALLLIAIAVAAATLLYVFAIGMLGQLSAVGGIQTKEQIILEAYSFPASSTPTLTVTLRNVGPVTENLAKADYFVSGIQVLGTSVSFGGGCPTTGSASSVTPSQSCAVTMSLSTASISLNPGAAYPFKMVTPTGGVFSYPVIYGYGA